MENQNQLPERVQRKTSTMKMIAHNKFGEAMATVVEEHHRKNYIASVEEIQKMSEEQREYFYYLLSVLKLIVRANGRMEDV